LIGVAAIVIVVLIVAVAFATIGPPGRARSEALDQQRVSDLGDTAADLHEDYGGAGASLPATLSRPRLDPVTDVPYEYRRLGDERYELCAVFELPTPVSRTDRDAATFWRHPAGKYCYQLNVRRYVESTL
jgi:hypothetical protein